MTPTDFEPEYSSYKDADGFVFYENNKVYRKINPSFLPKYEWLKSRGIYENLLQQKLLIPFTEVLTNKGVCLETTIVPIITYPYEWCFEQLKQAALLQLQLMDCCLKQGAILKDATPFNIQFYNNKACFIDLLSIEPYEEGTPWNGYKQFCEMFLAPLILSAYLPGNWNKSLAVQLEGIPLKQAAAALPFKASFNSLSLIHIISHSKFSSKGSSSQIKKISKDKIFSILNHLKSGIEDLTAFDKKSNWTSYENQMPYTAEELQLKKQSVENWLSGKQYDTVLDIGANHDVYAKLFHGKAKQVIAIDNDSTVIDNLCKKSADITYSFIPLHIDITMVSPALGLNLKERKSFFERVQPDMTIALALVHHLFHSRNIPLDRMAELFKTCSKDLIIEFISEEDEQFQKIRNINNHLAYDKTSFEKAFSLYFSINSVVEIKAGKRYLYYMTLKQSTV